MPVMDAQPRSRTPRHSTPLAGARVTFTGRVATMARDELVALVQQHGGTYVASVTRATTHLVVGMDGWPLARDGGVSGKLRRADELNERGASISILPEEALLEQLGLRAASSPAGKSIPKDHVLAACGLDAATLRRWEFAGLIRAHDEHYDFGDLVSLRTLAELVAAGVEPETIARSVRGLASVLPGTDRPLSQLRFVVEHGSSLLGAFAEALVDHSGQLVFDFTSNDLSEVGCGAPGTREPRLGSPAFGRRGSHDTDAAAGEAIDEVACHAPLAAVDPGLRPRHAARPRTAAEAFDLGVDCEDRGLMHDAEAAYRDAIARRAEFPEAHFNLGNVLRHLGRPVEAEAAFRLAIAQSPDFAEAWFNLADLLGELGATARLGEAIACLERAVMIEPDYADAHFNLARLLERQGRRREAQPHWRVYLEYDALSEWADLARSRLRATEV